MTTNSEARLQPELLSGLFSRFTSIVRALRVALSDGMQPEHRTINGREGLE